MSLEINKDIRTDAFVRYPCRNPQTGQICWCNKNSMKCRARGVKIRDFAGGEYNNYMGEESIVEDYKRIVNSIIIPSNWFGYLPLVIFGLTTYGTYYYYKKNKLKTAAVIGAIPMAYLLSPITRRLTKPLQEKPGN